MHRYSETEKNKFEKVKMRDVDKKNMIKSLKDEAQAMIMNRDDSKHERH